MKIITLKVGGKVIINRNVKITITSIKANRACLAFDAPKNVKICSLAIKTDLHEMD